LITWFDRDVAVHQRASSQTTSFPNDHIIRNHPTRQILLINQIFFRDDSISVVKEMKNTRRSRSRDRKRYHQEVSVSFQQELLGEYLGTGQVGVPYHVPRDTLAVVNKTK
jgi:hypothetical protein